MSLSKAIKSGKEHRIEYGNRRDYCKLVDSSCRNHGLCVWCQDNRTKKLREKDRLAKKEIENFKNI